MTYWDTSCVLKLYTPEPDSEAYLSLSDGAIHPLLSSELLSVELYFGLRRKEKENAIRRGAAEVLFDRFRRDVKNGRLILLPYGRDVATYAMDVARRCYENDPCILVRSLDGIHMATALISKARQIVTTDIRMREAAKILGIALIPH